MKMKILVAAALFIFFAIVVAIMVAGLMSGENSGRTLSESPTSEPKAFSLSEVSSHNSAESCWTVIRGKVYDITGLIETHSGGKEAALGGCGKDGSVGFDTKYKDESHSDKAKEILEGYYIGNLK